MRSLFFFVPLIVGLSVHASVAPTSGEIVSSLSSDLNGVHGSTSVVVEKNHLYICYIDSSLRVMIADKPLGSSTYRHSLVSSSSTDDAHNGCAIGIDSLGYIHIAYDMHASPLNYQRSMLPYDPTSLYPYPMPVASNSISYPLFIRSGSTLLFFYRSGTSSLGDECMNRLDLLQWVIVACPLINGLGISSPYVAVPKVDSNGNVHILWTLRTGFFNYGLFTSTYNPSSNSFSEALPLLGEIVLSSISRVSNVGMNILPEIGGDSQHRLVTYLGERGPTWEIFIANSSGLNWSHRQLSNEKAPRLRMCAGYPDIAEPRSCDTQIQAASLLKLSDKLLLVYGRSVIQPRGVFARPVARLLAFTSINGVNWSDPVEVPFMPALHCETVEEAHGLSYLLAQDCTNEDGPLFLYDTEHLREWGEESLYAHKFTTTSPVEISDAEWMSNPDHFSWTFTLNSLPSLQPIGLLDKSFLSGSREYRVVLWGYNASNGFVYHPDRMQIAIGDETGNWSLLWYPVVTVEPGLWTELRIEWDGSVVSLYKDESLVDQIAYSGRIKNTDIDLIIGGVRSGSNGLIVRPYSGYLHLSN